MTLPALKPVDLATTLYTQAMLRFKTLQANESATLKASGRSQFMTHGYQTEHAVVLLHGYTSAPQQFHALGQRLFALGHNVLIPRAPHHGLPDPLATAHAQLTTDELKVATQHALEIALGLGERVSVIGLSMGALMGGWLAQFQSDIDVAMLIAPTFGLRTIPRWLTPVMLATTLRLPNAFRWWDPNLKAAAAIPRHANARYATRGLANVLRLGRDLHAAARRSIPAARSIVVVTNANDETVDNTLTAKVVTAWRMTGAERVSTYEFPLASQLVHDLIDPAHPRQRVAYVYPVLIDLLQQAEN